MGAHDDKQDTPLWIYPKRNAELKEAIVKEFRLHRTMAQILVSRGFTTLDDVHHYLYAKLPDLIDPMRMPNMEKAILRILEAVERNEPILIYGDNDVDGMTGTALLTDFFQFIGAKPLFFISTPGATRQRFIIEALDYALEQGCKLLITVDCGITAKKAITEYQRQGIDVIITDHHEQTDDTPDCCAILNPKLIGADYPNRDITGVGVAFKLAHAITNRLVSENKIPPRKVDLKRYLDLVALGTVSDMATLVGENRIFVRYGLKQLRKTKRIGLAKLIGVCGVDAGEEITTNTIASKIAPRLNSLGRIADPQKGVQLLLVRNAASAEQLALELDLNNIERQKIERTMSADVESRLEKDPSLLKDKAIIMSSEAWHPGVIAILSTRISKQYNRPTIMLSIEDDVAKGSIRSIPEFPVLPILKECSDILLNFGGHDFAAGVTMNRENMEEFTRRFIARANETLDEQDVLNKLYLDAEVPFRDLTFDLMESIRLLEPYGNGNPPPVFHSNAKQAWPPKVVGRSHLKLYLEQSDRMLEGIGFGMGNKCSLLRKKDLSLNVAFTPQINTFQNKASIQLIIRDFFVQ